MNEHIDPSMDANSAPENDSNIFVNLHQEDSTGIPSLKNAPESAISSSESESKMSIHMVVALGVIAVGAGVIYAMRYIGMKAGLDEEIAQIDYTSQAGNSDVNKRFGTVMGELDESTIAVQLSDHDAFIDAPFSRPSAMGSTPEPVIQADPGMSQEERMALQRERELEMQRQERYDSVVDEAYSFKLQGVVGGTRPAARVSGLPVKVGSKLGDYFTVTQITGRSVVIEADGLRFELAMGEDTKQID